MHALAPQPGHGPAVAPVAGHGFGAAFADVHPVVGEDAVKVHDHGFHPPGQRGGFVPLQAPAQQRFRHGEVRFVVDFQAAVGRDFVDGGPAGKPMARPQEGRDPQGVDGARFFELVPQLLAHRAVGLVVAYGFGAAGRPAPEETAAAHRGKGGVVPAAEGADGAVDVLGQRQRRRALQKDQDTVADAGGVEGVGQGLLRGRQVTAQGRRPVHDVGAPAAADGSDFRIVGGDDDPADGFRLPGRFDGPGDERLAAQQPHVFSRHAFGAAPGGNDGQRLQSSATSGQDDVPSYGGARVFEREWIPNPAGGRQARRRAVRRVGRCGP